LFDDWTRAQAAIVLGRIGDPEDIADLRRLITADIERERAKPTGMIYANWYTRALLLLDANDADSTLIELLREENYVREAARNLQQLAVMPNRDNSFLRKATDFEAMWAARAGVRSIDFHAERAKRYAQAVTQLIENLKQVSAGVTNPEYYKILIEDLALVLAVLDGRDSADFVIEALTLPGRLHGHARKNGIRELLMSGATLSLGSILTVLGPVIDETKNIRTEQDIGLLFDCLELLPFSDDPANAIAYIEKAIGTPRYWPHQYRDLILAVGHARSDAAVSFLLNVACNRDGFRDMVDVWLEALGRLDTPASRNAVLSFIDPELPSIGLNVTFDFRVRNIFVTLVAKWARQDPGLSRPLIELSSGPLTATQSELLPEIYGELGSDQDLVAVVNLIQGRLHFFSRERSVERWFVERRFFGNSGSFELMPRDATRARASLFQAVLTDATRRRAASSILAQVEAWRLEHGRPLSEPRHPMIESGVAWPPLAFVN
jgi:hypothetical protein